MRHGRLRRSPSSASPRRRSTRGLYPVATRRRCYHAPQRLPPLRAGARDTVARAPGGARIRARGGRHRRRPGARGALPRVAAGRRDRRRARVRLLRRRGRVRCARAARTKSPLSDELVTADAAKRRSGTMIVRVTNTDHKERVVADRLTVGVAARLSRYLQVLTQAKKMGKERISSQEISDYTNINATQIRRDLSAFGKFGKRGVGYNIDCAARRDPQDPADAGAAQHRPRRRRPARPGDRELADLRRARDQHRRRLRQRPRQGRPARSATIGDRAPTRGLDGAVRDKNIIVGVLAVPADARPAGRATTSSTRA